MLAKRRVADSLQDVSQLHALLAEHVEAPEKVVVAIETDRGLMVRSLLAAGYRLYAINPLVASRYRERHVTSRAKSDAGDANVLADLVRTDRHNHRPVAGDSQLAEAVKVLARGHQNLIWMRQRVASQLRNALREFCPGALAAFAGDLASADAVAILEHAPTPQQGRSISQAEIVSALRKAGRERNLAAKAKETQEQLKAPQLEAPALLANAYGQSVAATVAVIKHLNRQIAQIEEQLAANFEIHPDAEIYLSLPGLGVVLGARAMAEFGDDRTRFDNPNGARAMPAPRPSPRPPAPATWSWLESLVIAACPMLATSGPSRLSLTQAALAATTTRCAAAARVTIRPCAPSPIGSSASSTAASSTARLYREDLAWPTPLMVTA